MTREKIKERVGRAVFFTAALLCAIAALAIFAFLLIRSLPAFQKIGVFRLIFGTNWSPDRLDTYAEALSGSYGIFKMVVGTLAATVGALLIGGTLGYFTAVFLAFYCPQRLKRMFSSMVSLLAGIPSVVYGFFGIVFLLPLLSRIAPNNGSGLLATAIILGIMILPTVVSLSKTALEAVPTAYYEGALALGSSHSQAVFGTMTRAARSGITASLVLGIGRALGETMAVVMVAGNSVAYPSSLFNSFRVLTANIVMEMGYAGEVQQGALIATGVILLVFVLLVNLLFGWISKRAVTYREGKEGLLRRLFPKKEPREEGDGLRAGKDLLASLRYRMHTASLGAGASIGAGVLVGLTLLLVIGFIFVKGAPHLFSDPYLLFGKYEFGSERITILPSLVTTLMTVALSLVLSVPLGLCAAIFLHEYAKKSNPVVRMIRGAIDLLNGVPSIVYGLFGMLTFVPLFGGTSSILAGSVTVAIMLLPTIIRSVEESLRSVSDSLREGSLALGAGKLRTIARIVLPSALPGIMSAVILSMGRVVSESAPFIYTMGSVISAMPTGYLDSNATLAVALYRLSGEGWYVNEAYGAAVVLILLVLGLNLLAGVIEGRLRRKLQGANA